jgi:DNA-binding HxlR family transcriptional regulator/DNA-binding response OmpR family regulator
MADESSQTTGQAPDHLLTSASLLSKKWHPAIVRCLADGDGYGFSDIEARLDGISAKVLNDALTELQDHLIVDRTEVGHQPLRVEYTLTERGVEFEAVIDSLADWGETYLAADDEEQVVLIADDDKRITTMHTTWLEDEYTIETATDGEELLTELDTDVDVIVLDRRMPGLSGDDVLAWLRAQQYDCRVVMVSSEDPDTGVLDLEFDEYLTKPARKDELREVVADLLERAESGRDVQEYLALRSKLAVIESELSPSELTDNDEYDRVRARVDELEGNIDTDVDTMSGALDRLEVDSNQ